MKVQKYKVTCLKCKKASLINIVNDTQPVYIDHVPICAARFRGDLQWGFECLCGNDSRVAKSEASQVEALVLNGGKAAVKKIVDGLKIKDELKFKMVAV